MPRLLKKQEAIWVYPKNDPILLKKIIDEFNIHPVTAQILISRNFEKLEDIHNYLYAKLPNLLDPDLFKDMDVAVKRILTAINKNEGILVYGDNDVDGMTAAALLIDFFEKIGAKAYYFIPNSTSQKKNILSEALDFSLEKKCSLIITVDCGITAAEEIKKVVAKGIDVIITDHHEPTSKIPHCIATLNPKLTDSTYPNREITGVGVAFKLAHAVANSMIKQGRISKNEIDLKSFLDLVALGTISDMGALIGENRIFVRYGLIQMKKGKRIGLKKLFEVCDVNPDSLTPIELASKVAPRLNSLGRIADPSKGVEMLLIKDSTEAQKLAKELDLYNIQRQKIEREASEDIDKIIKTNYKILDAKAIVLYSTNWHPGIIPIITARISKLYNRPTMIISIEDGIGKGSIRTIPEFPLLTTLKEASSLLINFGGHDFAAGLTIKEENILKLKKHFISAANKKLKSSDIISKLYLDAYIRFDDLTFDFLESIKLLEPFGTGNQAPILYTSAIQNWPPKIIGNSHLKFYLEQKDRMLEGIGFGMAHRKSQIRKKNIELQIAFTPHINNFLNKASIQLQIKDFKVTLPENKKNTP